MSPGASNIVRAGGGFTSRLLSPRRKTTSVSSRKKDEAGENPYSALGREKFTALLADVEEKKRMILAEMGADEDDSDAPLIRFVNSHKDGKLRPVVIRPNHNHNDHNNHNHSNYHHKHNSSHHKGESNKVVVGEGVSMDDDHMMMLKTSPMKAGLVEEKEREVELEFEKGDEMGVDEGSSSWSSREPPGDNQLEKDVMMKSLPPPPPPPSSPLLLFSESEVVKCKKVLEERKTTESKQKQKQQQQQQPCKLTAAVIVGRNKEVKEVEEEEEEEEESLSPSSSSKGGRKTSSSSSSKTKKNLQLEASHVYVGVIVVMVLMLLLLFERYWRIYYLLEFQTKMCMQQHKQQ